MLALADPPILASATANPNNNCFKKTLPKESTIEAFRQESNFTTLPLATLSEGGGLILTGKNGRTAWGAFLCYVP